MLYTSGAVRIFEALAVADGVEVKGEIIVTSIVKTEEQPPFAIKKSIPFEEKIDFGTETSNSVASAVANLTSVSAGVSES